MALGALAGAIGAILSLWPSPDPEDSAQLAVRVSSQIPLSEYRQRSVPTPPQFRADPTAGSAGPTSEPATPTAQATPSSAATSTARRPTATSSTQAPPPSPAGSPRRGFTTPGASNLQDVQATTGRVRAHVDKNVPQCDRTDEECRKLRSKLYNLIGSAPEVVLGNAVDSEGKPVDPAVAADRVAKLLRGTRSTSRDDEPLGAVVSADVELAGLRGRSVLLSWSMWQKGGDVRLHGEWLNSNLAYRLEPTTDKDTATVDLWVPLPKQPGPYFVRVDLHVDRTRLASSDSEPFD